MEKSAKPQDAHWIRAYLFSHLNFSLLCWSACKSIQAGQVSCMICKAEILSGLEERPMDSCNPACTRPPHMAAMQSCPLRKQHCVLLPLSSPGLIGYPWIITAPGEPHMVSTYRLKGQPHPVSSLSTWAVWALQASPYPCVLSIRYSFCLPPSSLPRPEPRSHHLVKD